MATIRMVFDPWAVRTVEQIAHPGLYRAGKAIEAAVPSFVPVRQGVMQDSYDPVTEDTGLEVRMHVGSPFWHWMEYGTRWNPPYRPVQSAVASLNLRYEAQ